MPTLTELIEERVSRLESIPDKFISTTEKAQRDILKSAIASIESLDRKKGVITLSAGNINKIESIANEVLAAVFDSPYLGGLEEYAGEFLEQSEISKKIIGKSFGKFTNKQVFDAVLKKSQSEAIALLSEDAIKGVFINPLKELINDGISNQVTFAEMVTSLQDFISGTPELDGVLLRHVKQIARDQFAFADRRYNQVVSEEIGAEFYKYVGGTLTDSRVFCVNRTGRIFHISEIRGWGSCKGVDSGGAKGSERAGCPWQGMFRGTNTSNITTVLGGYNCIHILIAIATSQVPPSVIKRL